MKKLIVISLVMLSVLLVSCGSKPTTTPITDTDTGFINENAKGWADSLGGKEFNTLGSGGQLEKLTFTSNGTFSSNVSDFSLNSYAENSKNVVFCDINGTKKPISVLKQITEYSIVQAEFTNQIIMLKRDYVLDTQTGKEIKGFLYHYEPSDEYVYDEENNKEEGEYEDSDGNKYRVSYYGSKSYQGYNLSSDGNFLFKSEPSTNLEDVSFEQKTLDAYSLDGDGIKRINASNWLNNSGLNKIYMTGDGETFNYDKKDYYPYLRISEEIGVMDAGFGKTDRFEPLSYENTKTVALRNDIGWVGSPLALPKYEPNFSGVSVNGYNYKYLIFITYEFKEHVTVTRKEYGYYDITVKGNIITLNEYQEYGSEYIKKVGKTLKEIN